jgi:hypothetical protein
VVDRKPRANAKELPQLPFKALANSPAKAHATGQRYITPLHGMWAYLERTKESKTVRVSSLPLA